MEGADPKSPQLPPLAAAAVAALARAVVSGPASPSSLGLLRGFPSNPAPERLSFSDSSDYGYSSDGSAESPHPVVSGKGKGMEVAPL